MLGLGTATKTSRKTSSTTARRVAGFGSTGERVSRSPIMDERKTMKHRTKSELIESLLAEMNRIWGPDGFGGKPEAYAWLQEHFKISEEEDVKWQDVLSEWAGTLEEDTADLDEDEQKQVKAFLQDDSAVIVFLESLLHRYKSSDTTYPG
ncbi:hypothetical protein [Pseudomonas syringae]|uniref:hypothetical protein n=1 Tax=Pseudomonas syringae TaxID=317 RepID=UPI001EFE8C16|nr:hypothetical protein [Pseudomonas syringae]